jgi:PHS family inorganic phosphate transporter-like MFS transporter
MAAAVNNQLHAREVSEALNEVKFSGFHLRAIITAGMGFFSSAYDLTVIGTALALAGPEWKKTFMMNNPHGAGTFVFLMSLVASVSLAATFIGALAFGTIADKIGRKSVYGIEAVLMSIGAIGSAFAMGPISMIVWRTIMGFGIGGDYPLSGTLMAEYANRQDRGKMVGMVFSCQALGFVFGPVVVLTMLAAGVSDSLTWRIALGLGALPSLGVIILRRSMPESPRWTARARGRGEEAAAALTRYSNGVTSAAGKDSVVREPLSKYALTLIGTAGTWFVCDYAYYGNTVGMPMIIKSVAPHGDMLASVAWNVLIFGVFAVPGYVLAFMTCDKLGRKSIQMLGFALMGLMFLILGAVPALSHNAFTFITIFGLSYFFTEFGPNVTTYILSSELYPVNLRTTGFGISAGVAKFGAFLGVIALGPILAKLGFAGGMYLSFGMSIVGLILTAICIKEPAGKSLEEASLESNWVKPETASESRMPVGV